MANKIARLKVKEAAVKERAVPQSEFVVYESETLPAARLRVFIEGKSALLTHNPQSMTMTRDAMKGGRIPSPEDEAEAGCYRLADGSCGIKGESLRGSLLGAAGAWRMKKSSARSRLAHIIVIEELLTLLDPDGKPITSYQIDRRRAIVQKQGIIRSRPRFDPPWSLQPTFEYDQILVPEPKLIIDILQDAGNRIGIGDYRPVNNGWFGRFVVKGYQRL
jgi:hypothetical protein